MKIVCSLLLFLLLSHTSTPTPASSIKQADTSTLEATIHDILNAFIDGDSFRKFHDKHYPESKGTIVMELVVKGKKVESIFIQSSDVSSIKFVNAFSNYIKDFTFDFKLEKGQRLKISHTFNIK